MIGADEYYDLIYNANRFQLGNLRKLILKYGWTGGDSEAFINNNVIYVTSTHARGKCFDIYLVEDIHRPDEQLYSIAFKVYGIISGNPGWTETYGWLYDGDGAWVNSITKYLKKLDDQIKEYNDNIKKGEEEQDKIKKMKLKEQLRKFDTMFA